MSYVNYHPVCLDLNGRRILIVGGGAIALEKLESLMPFSGAVITVVSPEARKDIRDWHAEGKLTWEKREFAVEDVADYFMVIAATDDPVQNHLVYKTGNEANKLANSVDDSINCNFIMAALVRRGPMQVAVSSAGGSPALAQRVRNRIRSEILTEQVGDLCEFLGDRRPLVKLKMGQGYRARQAFWERVIDSELPGILHSHGSDAAHTVFERMLEEAASDPIQKRYGKVSLVGAGPGDPDLLTLKAVRALQKANVVLYDRLVDPRSLEHANPKAKCIYVGKDPVRHQSKKQGGINYALIQIAKSGRDVVRLKGGDPYVFGRGSEEEDILREAGIEVEVVPGISSSVAGPGAAGIPVTKRGISTAFGVFTAHEADGKDSVPWDAAARMPTAVFLMGVDKLPIIVRRLIEAGQKPWTPVAVVSKATLPDQQVAIGTLETIIERAAGLPAPAVVVVGEVVLSASTPISISLPTLLTEATHVTCYEVK